MKRGGGIKALDDKSSGMEILIAEVFAKINPTFLRKRKKIVTLVF
jgi:hypothetical protein